MGVENEPWMLESALSRGLQKKRAAMARLKVRGVRKWSRGMLRGRGGVPGEELDRDGKEGAVNFCPRDTGVTGGGRLGEAWRRAEFVAVR